MVSTRPAPARDSRGCDARIPHGHEAPVAKRNRPAAALGSVATSPDVATEVDRRVVEALAETIREPSLAHPTEVDRAARSHASPAGADVEHLWKRWHLRAHRLASQDRRMSTHGGDRPVVPRGDKRGKAGGIDEAVAQQICVEAHAEQLAEERGDGRACTGRGVEPREFAAGVETRQPALEGDDIRHRCGHVSRGRIADHELASRSAERREGVTDGAGGCSLHET